LPQLSGKTLDDVAELEQIDFRGWILEVDAAATSAAYAAAGPVGPEACRCRDCRNFIAARDAAYPAELKELATRLGVVPLTETEIWEYGPFDSEQPLVRLYGGFFHFVGRILRDPGTGDFDVHFRPDRSLLPDAFGAQPVVQVGFSFPVPWMLEEPPGE
jgi:hypothetical protein